MDDTLTATAGLLLYLALWCGALIVSYGLVRAWYWLTGKTWIE